MEYMRGLPDKAFDLAIVDPPYGIGAGNYKRGGINMATLKRRRKYMRLKIGTKVRQISLILSSLNELVIIKLFGVQIILRASLIVQVPVGWYGINKTAMVLVMRIVSLRTHHLKLLYGGFIIVGRECCRAT
jgi:hypothetical protein